MTGGGVAHTVVLYSLVIALGVALGSKVKIAGISLGVTWILFVGILAGDLLMRGGVRENLDVLNFVQDFGLILFVFSIGLQVGPSFFTSLKQGGLKANGVAAGIVALNITVMLVLYYACRNFIPAADNLPMMVGTLCGAVTNTPGLGAANAALDQINAVNPKIFAEGVPVIANGYACAYPLGVVGIILSIVLIRVFFKVNFKAEEEHFNKKNGNNAAVKPHLMTIKVFNPAINGKSILQVRGFIGRDFVCSRLLHDGHITVPNKDTLLTVDDKLYIVCAHDDLGVKRGLRQLEHLVAHAGIALNNKRVVGVLCQGAQLRDNCLKTLPDVRVVFMDHCLRKPIVSHYTSPLSPLHNIVAHHGDRPGTSQGIGRKHALPVDANDVFGLQVVPLQIVPHGKVAIHIPRANRKVYLRKHVEERLHELR